MPSASTFASVEWICARSTGHKYEPIVFIFGMGIDCGKISTPIVLGGNPESRWPPAAILEKKLKTSDFCFKTCFRQFPAKKIFFFFWPTKFFSPSGLVLGGNPESKMAAGGHFGKKLKTSDFCFKTCFRQFPAKKIFFFFGLLNFFRLWT